MKAFLLTYHRLSRVKEKNHYIIEEKDFIRHLEYLSNNNYRCMLADDYYESLINPLYKLPPKSVILTFDDGYSSDFKISLPILKKHDFKATFFITTDWIGKPGYMNQDQLRILKKEGMSVQCHGKTHLFLDEMESNEIYHELEQSKKTLESILENRVSFISFPGGRYNRNVINCAKNLGYAALFSSVPFYLKKFGDIYLVGRYMIKQLSGNTDFEKIFNSDVMKERKDIAFYYGKFFLKKMLGNTIYHSLWRKYTH